MHNGTAPDCWVARYAVTAAFVAARKAWPASPPPVFIHTIIQFIIRITSDNTYIPFSWIYFIMNLFEPNTYSYRKCNSKHGRQCLLYTHVCDKLHNSIWERAMRTNLRGYCSQDQSMRSQRLLLLASELIPAVMARYRPLRQGTCF